MALQHLFNGSLVTPPRNAGPDPSRLFTFNQSLYANGTVFSGLADTGYVYVPATCSAVDPCRLHVAFHGCGMAASWAAMNTSFALHAGYAPWADANGIVVLFPQGGWFKEHGLPAPSGQISGGCFDGGCQGARGRAA
jgi:hypothetical protein